MIRVRKRRNNRITKIVCIVLCFLILLSFSVYKMHPVIMSQAVSVAETIMLNCANEAVIRILSDENFTYDSVINLTNNSDGYVTSLETDIYEVNFLKSRISNEIANVIMGREFYDFKIPIGTFLGSDFTNGFGPKIKFYMQITTTAFVDFSYEFKSAGINQVLHIINVDIKIKGNLLIMGYNKPIETKTSVIAAETIIVGKTPDAFTNVVESPTDNTGGLINDYGAIAE